MITRAQTPVSPLQSIEGKTIRASKFALFYDQYSESRNANEMFQFIGKFRATQFPPGTIDTSDWRKTNSYDKVTAGARDLDFKSGDFNGDGYDDYVSVVLDTNAKPYIQYSRMDTATMKYAYTYGFEINNTVASVVGGQSRLNLAVGNFDGNGVRDFVVGFVDNATKELRLQWYWLNGGTNPVLRSSVTVPKDSTFVPVTLGYDLNAYHMCTGDFDNDGDDELAVMYLAPGQFNQLYITYPHIAIFEMENGQFVFKGSKLIINGADDEFCSLVSGNFSGTGKQDLAFARGYDNTSRVDIARVDLTQDAANVLSFSNSLIYYNVSGISSLAAGDLNGDGTDEIVWAGENSLKIIRINNPGMTPQNMSIGVTSYLNGIMYYSNSGLQVADVDRDGKEEIIAVSLDRSSSSEIFRLELFNTQANLSAGLITKASRTLNNWDNEYSGGGFPPSTQQYPPRRFAFTAGDFDGNDFTVGTPTYFHKTDIVQPLVILNAPPVHFDIFNDTAYDVTKCYNQNNCDFSSTYYTANSTQIDVSTEVHQDWGVSGTLSAGGSFGIVDVGGYMTATYGEQYSNIAGSSTTVNISTEVSAVEDDYIYATVANFDVWEYPIFRKGKLLGNMITVKPTVTTNQWFPSKSWNAFTYTPNHEVGCIMSYKNYPNLDHPDAEEKIKASYQGNSYTLGANNSFSWSLTFNDVTTNSASTQKDIGVEVGANVGAYGVSLETSASYNQSQIKTYTSTVTNDLSLTTSISSALDMGIGEVRYTITPYSYWAKNGALVLDYAAAPELQTGGGTPTWWAQRYMMQDPAFILPWRYDPEKGFTLQDNRKRRQTKSISFNPASANSGDTVKVRAVIHNFGLLPTNAPVALKFYIGDPIHQNLITDIYGNSSFNIPVIAERDRQIVEIEWKVPSGIYQFPKIYASIDPDNTITELHRNNNIGWNIFSVTDGSSVDPDTIVSSILEEKIFDELRLLCYPNPATNELFVYLEGLQAEQICIYNTDGKLLSAVTSPDRNRIDISQLPAGMYVAEVKWNDMLRRTRWLKL